MVIECLGSGLCGALGWGLKELEGLAMGGAWGVREERGMGDWGGWRL